MSTKHTPGPWQVVIEGTVSAEWPHIYTQDDYEVAQISDNTSESGEPAPVREMALANARLIAAAPELLDLVRAYSGTVQPVTLAKLDKLAQALLARIDGQEAK